MASHGIRRLSFRDTVPNPREASKTLEVDVTDVEVTPDPLGVGLLLTGSRRRVLVPWSNIRAVEYAEKGDTPGPLEATNARRLPKT